MHTVFGLVLIIEKQYALYLVGYSTHEMLMDPAIFDRVRLRYSHPSSLSDDNNPSERDALLTPQSPLLNIPPSLSLTSLSSPSSSPPKKPSAPIKLNLTLADLADIYNFTEGTNASIWKAKYRGETVIIKMVKRKMASNALIIREFEMEKNILLHTNHPNVIRLLGAGKSPRLFLVLEYLNEGTLAHVLRGNQSQTRLGRAVFPKVTFPWPELLRRALELAEALKYLHEDCFKDSTIIHRDLKPDNIGFVDGKLKLFDMGLSICVAKSANPSDAFEMTGCTGTLRYMAPEVALNKPYSEKSDVYSYGIILWQMASDRIPFKRAKDAEFRDRVIRRGLRPELNPSWPKDFQEMLQLCWHMDAAKRPSFKELVEFLKYLINERVTSNMLHFGRMASSLDSPPRKFV